MIHESVTPSGFAITFEDGLPDESGRSKKRKYLVNGEELPSVTTILRCLDKPGLMYWTEELGVAGCIELAATGELPDSVDGAMSRLTKRGLRHWQVSERKAERGTIAHEDLVALMAGTELRSLDDYPTEQRGFIRGVSAWYADYRPEVIQAEVMVASLVHGYAGRPDAFARFPTLRGRTGRVDLKTSDKPIKRYKDGSPYPPYPEALLQLGLYEIAAVESGYDASDFRAVLRVDSTGAYDFSISHRPPEAALNIVPAYRELSATKQRPKEDLLAKLREPKQEELEAA